MKSLLNFILRAGVSVLLLWWLSTKIDFEQTQEVLRTADIKYLSYALGVFLLINALMLYRWLIFIKALSLKAPQWDVVRYFFIGLFGNLFLPSAMGGDAIKIVGLCKGSEEKPKVVASILLDRLTGYAAVILVGLGAFLLGFSYINDVTLGYPILIMLPGSIIALTVLFNEKAYAFCIKIFARIKKLTNALMQFHYDLALLKDHKKKGFLAIGIACTMQLLFAFTFFLIAKALGQDAALIYYFIFVPLLCIAQTMPSIGGLGVREGAAVLLFGQIGMSEGVSARLGFISFLFMVIVGLIGGIVYVITLSFGRVQHPASDP